MIFIDLINNLALLVALSVLSGFIGQRWKNSVFGALLQGLVFGGVSVIGMLRPFVLAEGLVFDGRSVVISLCGLFYGPIAAAVAWWMAVLCRIWPGGVGAPMGVCVITSSALLGYAFHVWQKRRKAEFNSWQLWGFGVLVHLAMLCMTLALPADRILPTLKTISAPVLLIYPVATVLIGRILSDHEARYEYVASLRESEERFKRAMEANKDGLWDWNIQTGEVYFSPGYVTMLGYEPGELHGDFETWRGLLHSEDLPAIQEAVQQSLNGLKENYEVEFRMRTKDGEWHWVLARGKVVERDSQGNPLRMVGTHTDLTNAKQAEQTLRESEERYRTLFDEIQDGVYRSTHAGRFVDVNPAMIRILGYDSREEVLALDIKKDLYFEPEERESLFLDTASRKSRCSAFAARTEPKSGSRTTDTISTTSRGMSSFTKAFCATSRNANRLNRNESVCTVSSFRRRRWSRSDGSRAESPTTSTTCSALSWDIPRSPSNRSNFSTPSTNPGRNSKGRSTLR
jgi:PAS domain S-box-containing protein